jgi:hypothetical protein
MFFKNEKLRVQEYQCTIILVLQLENRKHTPAILPPRDRGIVARGS